MISLTCWPRRRQPPSRADVSPSRPRCRAHRVRLAASLHSRNLPPMDISGSAAIVTGGASGLGEATARRLVAGGATVTVFDKNEERGKQVVSEIGSGASFVGGDVTDPADCQRAVDQAAE